MELVEGEDLSQRIARGAIPLDEALPIAKQIAEALEAAHEQGIIHRDLKPANIKVRPDGTVKVLDFGLAKAMEPVGSAPDVSQSPTITTPAMMTGVGVILGTAAYMAPGAGAGARPVDKRADIWAFGAVLFEMLTGKRAFDGEDVGDTLAAVLRAEPDWNALPAEVAFPVRTLLRGCLEKNPRQRIADISAALFVLRHQATGAAADGPAHAETPGVATCDASRSSTTAALLLGAAVAGTGVWLLTRPAPPSVVRTTITTSGSTALMLSGIDRDIAITPDGTRVVYRGNNQLLVRDAQPARAHGAERTWRTTGPIHLARRPVGWVFRRTRHDQESADHGWAASRSCVRSHGPTRGATWGSDGTIIFATNAPGDRSAARVG